MFWALKEFIDSRTIAELVDPPVVNTTGSQKFMKDEGFSSQSMDHNV